MYAIPFTTDVPGSGGSGTLTAGPDQLTVSGASGSWSVPLTPAPPQSRPGHARWLRRGLTGMGLGLLVGVSTLALTLPGSGAGTSGRSVADPDGPQQHTEVAPPVVRTLTFDSATASRVRSGGTP